MSRPKAADTALRLGKYFGASAQLWLNLQTQYDLDMAKSRGVIRNFLGLALCGVA